MRRQEKTGIFFKSAVLRMRVLEEITLIIDLREPATQENSIFGAVCTQ
jgi:hypothetical protein